MPGVLDAIEGAVKVTVRSVHSRFMSSICSA